jgi:predicted  nucleic acid-binding Zn-ribbon protein
MLKSEIEAEKMNSMKLAKNLQTSSGENKDLAGQIDTLNKAVVEQQGQMYFPNLSSFLKIFLVWSTRMTSRC